MLSRQRRRIISPLPSVSDDDATPGTSDSNSKVKQNRKKKPSGVRGLARMVYDLTHTVNSVVQASPLLGASTAAPEMRPAPEAQLMLPRDGMIPQFDPEKGDITIEKWISKIEELRIIFNWTEIVTIHHVVTNLRGLAQRWYSTLPNITMSWEGWRTKLLEAFPSQANYCTALTEMLQRQKHPHETYLKYYYEKLTLLAAVRIVEKDAVSCIIGGIGDSHVRATAEAGGHERPEALLKFLQQIETRERHPKIRPSDRYAQNKYRPHYQKQVTHKFTGQCFVCKKHGHRANDCRLVKQDKPKSTSEVCQNCKKPGHTATTCWSKRNNRVL